MALSVHQDVALPYLLELTTEEQKERWLPGCASGELIARSRCPSPGPAPMSRRSPRERAGTAATTSSPAPRPSSATASTLMSSSPPSAPGHRSAWRYQHPRARAWDGGVRARAQPREARDARAGHRGAVLRRGPGTGREPARRGGPRLLLPDAQLGAGASGDRRHRQLPVPAGRSGARSSMSSSAGVRTPDRHLPELTLQARGVPR